jgi:osmotically-inducible protein OsmY
MRAGTRAALFVGMRNNIDDSSQAATLERVYRALERDSRVDVGAHPLSLLIADGTLVIEGEVADEDARERAVEIARSQRAVRRVVDRMVVKRRAVKRATSSSTSLRHLRPRLRMQAR